MAHFHPFPHCGACLNDGCHSECDLSQTPVGEKCSGCRTKDARKKANRGTKMVECSGTLSYGGPSQNPRKKMNLPARHGGQPQAQSFGQQQQQQQQPVFGGMQPQQFGGMQQQHHGGMQQQQFGGMQQQVPAMQPYGNYGQQYPSQSGFGGGSGYGPRNTGVEQGLGGDAGMKRKRDAVEDELADARALLAKQAKQMVEMSDVIVRQRELQQETPVGVLSSMNPDEQSQWQTRMQARVLSAEEGMKDAEEKWRTAQRKAVELSEKGSKLLLDRGREIADWRRKYEALVAAQGDSELRKRDEEIAMLKRERDAALQDAATLRLELSDVPMAEEAAPAADSEIVELLRGAAELEADGVQVRKDMADQELRQRAAHESENAQRVPTGTLDSGATDFVAPVPLERLPGEGDIQYVVRKRKAEGFNFNLGAGRQNDPAFTAGGGNHVWQTPANPTPSTQAFVASSGQHHNGQNHNFAPPDTRSDIEKAVAKRRARREGGN
ncbi:hypothetical protein LTR17_013183 [Elasticomyces elasticus]|nr:hypothetical protein LTR17_013183 [Elasticomyces elasticus]